MSDVLIRRGPDAKSLYVDENAQLGLADRRLSILGLSSAGHQPIGPLCVPFTLEFNADICNHLDLRQMLEKEREAFNFQKHSNTKILLADLRNWVSRTV